jgi:hypothetical protein
VPISASQTVLSLETFERVMPRRGEKRCPSRVRLYAGQLEGGAGSHPAQKIPVESKTNFRQKLRACRPLTIVYQRLRMSNDAARFDSSSISQLAYHLLLGGLDQ